LCAWPVVGRKSDLTSGDPSTGSNHPTLVSEFMELLINKYHSRSASH
jgi:hypothetical protein